MIIPSYQNCTRCKLSKTRKKIVFGFGSVPAQVLFILGAPGEKENILGIPLTGMPNRVFLAAIDFAYVLEPKLKKVSWYMSTIVSCYPGGPFEPSGEEAYACWPRLAETHTNINPQAIVLLGKTAKQYGLKSWPSASCLMHPAIIAKQGGVENPLFRAFARDLSHIFKGVQ